VDKIGECGVFRCWYEVSEADGGSCRVAYFWLHELEYFLHCITSFFVAKIAYITPSFCYSKPLAPHHIFVGGFPRFFVVQNEHH
jgi:hypothetical protein